MRKMGPIDELNNRLYTGKKEKRREKEELMMCVLLSNRENVGTIIKKVNSGGW